MKLTGRIEAPDGDEGAQSLSARGAKPQAHHGSLQRLLEGSLLHIRQVPGDYRRQQPHQLRIHEFVLIRDIEAYQAATL